MVPESHWQFKKCGRCHKRPLENTEGTCWVHFLGLSHLDPLLSLCLCSGSVRKVNHRHLAADPRFPLCFEQSPFPRINPEPRYFMSTRLIKDGDLYCCGTTIKGNSRNRVLFPVTARLRCYSYFFAWKYGNIKRRVEKKDKYWAVIKIHIYAAQFSLRRNSMCWLAGSIWSSLRKEMSEPPGPVISG